ncbi:hypothetical protein TBLA_0A09360 [Henningerozyma blattae CBS 6284]|uniref:Zinc finger PHD-type domain-containing protein n=1 Tax=Henningerozyma blattae (strain ATCC 34711 / CBS 6284 / DSM 70876 / NBRC 10599 / NRRL Y-10934 / UCD 77-7) TaxID=1071380 RepID=I2GX69_HENB6|nr:hypothetical protein TBLA_0A09360 [Tetrapisispora blattae CBS 6284]CCH58721.1 hypothetical protein TBLA_0A09360 [Tetrapisispora blattae CBS 6284]
MDTRHAFLGTLDHLPAELIRSLWLLQYLNVSNESNNNSTPASDVTNPTLVRNSRHLVVKYLHDLITHQEEKIRLENTFLQTLLKNRSHELLQKNNLKHSQNGKHPIGKHQHSHNKQPLKKRLTVKITLNPPSVAPVLSTKESKISPIINDSTPIIKKKRGRRPKLQQQQILEESVVPPLSRLSNTQIQSHKLRSVKQKINPIPSDDTLKINLNNKKIKGKWKKTSQPITPTEPTYCYCNDVSYGKMVACDNDDCKIEWFHYNCIKKDMASSNPTSISSAIDNNTQEINLNKKWFCSKDCETHYYSTHRKLRK